MNLSVGIVGLPNAGKSTLFNALRGIQSKFTQGKAGGLAQTGNYPFTTIEPNIGVVPVPDERLDKLALTVAQTNDGHKPPIVPALVKFVDIAGLVKGAHKGEGLGNQFLAHIRECEAICFVLRDFEDPQVVKTGSNPKDDLEVLQSELILKDLETVEKIQNTKIKSDNEKIKIQNLTQKLIKGFNQGLMATQIVLEEEERKLIKPWCLLTDKPYFVVLNVSEKDLLNLKDKIKTYYDWPLLPICAKMEEELTVLSVEEQKEYLKSMGLEKSGLERLIQIAYGHLGLISFFTAGEKEVRAWTIVKGSTALQASSVIHSDFAKHFIKAKVIGWREFVEAGGWQKAREMGKIRLEGRDYLIKEGEVVEFEIGK